MRQDKYFPKDDVGVSEVVPAENETQRVLRRALERLGPNGEHWCKFEQKNEAGHNCAIGALSMAATGYAFSVHDDFHAMRPLVRAAKIMGATKSTEDQCDGWIVANLNNNAADFSEVQEMFHRAISLAGES